EKFLARFTPPPFRFGWRHGLPTIPVLAILRNTEILIRIRKTKACLEDDQILFPPQALVVAIPRQAGTDDMCCSAELAQVSVNPAITDVGDGMDDGRKVIEDELPSSWCLDVIAPDHRHTSRLARDPLIDLLGQLMHRGGKNRLRLLEPLEVAICLTQANV